MPIFCTAFMSPLMSKNSRKNQSKYPLFLMNNAVYYEWIIANIQLTLNMLNDTLWGLDIFRKLFWSHGICSLRLNLVGSPGLTQGAQADPIYHCKCLRLAHYSLSRRNNAKLVYYICTWFVYLVSVPSHVKGWGDISGSPECKWIKFDLLLLPTT